MLELLPRGVWRDSGRECSLVRDQHATCNNGSANATKAGRAALVPFLLFFFSSGAEKPQTAPGEVPHAPWLRNLERLTPSHGPLLLAQVLTIFCSQDVFLTHTDSPWLADRTPFEFGQREALWQPRVCRGGVPAHLVQDLCIHLIPLEGAVPGHFQFWLSPVSSPSVVSPRVCGLRLESLPRGPGSWVTLAHPFIAFLPPDASTVTTSASAPLLSSYHHGFFIPSLTDKPLHPGSSQVT